MNSKDMLLQLVTKSQAREIIESKGNDNWYFRPYQYDMLYVTVDYEEDSIVCEMEYYNEILRIEKEENVRFTFYQFKGFRSREIALDYLGKDEAIKYHPKTNTFTIHY